jgi:putative chitinase
LSKVFGKSINLLADPDLALEPDYAAEIMFFGMSAGTFTGKKFSDYFTIDKKGKPLKDNWVGARAIINGNDKDQVIANFGKDYYSCLSHI